MKLHISLDSIGIIRNTSDSRSIFYVLPLLAEIIWNENRKMHDTLANTYLIQASEREIFHKLPISQASLNLPPAKKEDNGITAITESWIKWQMWISIGNTGTPRMIWGFLTCVFFFKDAENLGTRHHIHFFSTSTEHIDLNWIASGTCIPKPHKLEWVFQSKEKNSSNADMKACITGLWNDCYDM